MSEADDVQSLYDNANRLTNQRDFRGVDQLLSKQPKEYLLGEPELCLMLASAWSFLFRNEEAKELLVRLRPRLDKIGDRTLMRRWQNLFAIQLLRTGVLDEAERLLNECLASAEAEAHQRMIAYANNNLGIISSLYGDVDEALRRFGRATAAWQLLGERLGVGTTHHNLGLVLREWGRWKESIEHFTLAEDYFSCEGIPEERVFTVAERAMLAMVTGDLALAERLAREAVEKAHDLSNTYLTAAALRVLGCVLLNIGDTLEARLSLEAAQVAAETTNEKLLKAEINEELAILYLGIGDAEKAEEHRANALSFFSEIGSIKHCVRLKSRFEEHMAGNSP